MLGGCEAALWASAAAANGLSDYYYGDVLFPQLLLSLRSLTFLKKAQYYRSGSFCGRPFQTEMAGEASYSSPKLKKNTTTMMRRPKTHPELLNRDDRPVLMNNTKMNTPVESLTVNKLLVNVTVAQSSGPLRLLLSKDATVEDVIKGTLLLYAKEGRKPLLTNDPTSFGLHYSQFSIDCLNRADKIKDLGSRTFFLCSKATAKVNCRLSCQRGETTVTHGSSSSCGKDIEKITEPEPWYKKLMQCILLPLRWIGIS